MSNVFRRYEILLPLRYGDGSPVSEEVLDDALLEVQKRFGYWRLDSQLYPGERTRVLADVPDTSESNRFFLELKERLKGRFRQGDIWMTTHPIERL